MRETSRQVMLETNARQKEFYESRYESSSSPSKAPERAANRPTWMWTKLRRRFMRLRAAAGADDYLLDLHREWLGDISGARVLDLGCFWGNALSLPLARQAGEYVGIDLSEQAVAALNAKLQAENLAHAKALRLDFLANDWPDGHFDVVYAYSVLHHFADLDTALSWQEDFYRDLHAHPELMYQERRTSEVVRRELAATVVTRDGLPSVHVEHTLALTSSGVQIITADDEAPVASVIPDTFSREPQASADRVMPSGATLSALASGSRLNENAQSPKIPVAYQVPLAARAMSKAKPTAEVPRRCTMKSATRMANCCGVRTMGRPCSRTACAACSGGSPRPSGSSSQARCRSRWNPW